MEGWKLEWERARERVEACDRALEQAERERPRIAELEQRFERARREHASAQAEVDRLQGLGFRSLLHALIGDKRERLAAAERAADEARTRSTAAHAELSRSTQELAELEQRLDAFEGAEAELERMEQSRVKELAQGHGPDAPEFESIAERGDRLRSERRELHAARLVGDDAGELLDQAVALLRQAANFGAVDMLGAGLLVSHVKHDRIGDARRLFERATDALREFEQRLRASVGFEPPTIALGRLDAGLDVFMDGLLADAFVQRRIHEAHDGAEEIRDEVEEILTGLDARYDAIGSELGALAEKRRELLERSA